MGFDWSQSKWIVPMLVASAVWAGVQWGMDDSHSDGAGARAGRSPLPVRWEVMPVTVPRHGSGRAEVRIQLPPGASTYRDDVRLVLRTDSPVGVQEPVFPVGEWVRQDGEEGPMRMRYADALRVELPVDVGEAEAGVHTLELEGQIKVCSASGCHRSAEERLELVVVVTDPPTR